MKDQVITFAAICQIAYQVQQVSQNGQIDDDELSFILNSIINMSPKNTLDVYGGNLAKLKQGLTLVVSHLERGSKQGNIKDPEFTRYIINLINLERRLIKQPKKLTLLGERIEATQRQLEHYNIISEPLLASFASIYSDIISPLSSPIQVSGNPAILNQTINQYKIRSLLLAGIRSAVLWRQVGGKRRTILLSRTKLVNTAKQLLNEIN